MRTKYKIRLIFHTCSKSWRVSQNEALDALKQKQKRKDSQITLFIEDNFYNEAKEVLKVQAEGQNSDSNANEAKLTKWQATTLKRKKWTYHEGKIQTSDQKIVVPKSQLYDVLT